MAGGLSVDIGANTRAAAANVKSLGDQLGEVVEALGDVGDAAPGASARLDRALEQSERQAKQTRDAVQDVGERGFGRASEAAGEFRNEAKQNFSEVTSSFSGDMASIGDLAQGTLGGLAASLPGIGLVAGAAAVGVGLITSAIQGIGEQQKLNQQQVGEWAQAYIDSGGQVLTSAVSTQKALDIIQDPDRWAEAQRNATNWGVDTATAIAAMSGQTWALTAAQKGLDDQVSSGQGLNEQEQQLNQLGGAFTSTTTQVRDGQSALDALNGTLAAGKDRADTYSRYLVDLARNTDGATFSIDEFGDTVYHLPDGHEVYIDAQTGQATDNVDDINRKIYSIPSSTDTTVRVHVDSTEWDRWTPSQKNSFISAQPSAAAAMRYGG